MTLLASLLRHGVFVTVLLGIPPAAAVDYFLDSGATGGNNGTSWEDAWTDTRLIDWSKLQEGDTLVVQGGDYSNLIVSRKKNITIRIAENATRQAVFTGHPSDIFDVDDSIIDGLLDGKPMFRFPGDATPYTVDTPVFLLRIRLSQGTLFRGLEVEREHLYQLDETPVNGINVNNSTKPTNDFLTFEHCSVHHVAGDGININAGVPGAGYNHFIFRNLRIENVMDDGIHTSGGVTIQDCYINRKGEVGKFATHQDGIQVARSAKWVKIHNNFITDFSQNIFVELSSGPVQLYNNVLAGTLTNKSERGMLISVNENAPYEGEFLLANNTFYRFLTFYGIHGGGTIDRAVPEANRYFGNNIFINCKAVMSSAPHLLDLSNTFWDTPGVQYYTSNGTPTRAPSNRSAGTCVFQDPGVRDHVNLDFTLVEGSTSIGTGKDYGAFFSVDIANQPRVAPWGRGAFHYTGFVPLPPPEEQRSRRFDSE